MGKFYKKPYRPHITIGVLPEQGTVRPAIEEKPRKPGSKTRINFHRKFTRIGSLPNGDPQFVRTDSLYT